MATPGQLVKAMADTLGISKATVTQYDRVLARRDSAQGAVGERALPG